VVEEIEVHLLYVYTLYMLLSRVFPAKREMIAVGDSRLLDALNSGGMAICPLNFRAFWPILKMQTNLSAMVAVSQPAGGEMSGLTAHFLFGAKASGF
jgi:hypothetical protein